jgi:putative DNA primase/helicase
VSNKIDFKGLATAALGCSERLLASWLPDGRRDGHEWKALNPMRADHSAGSFSINLFTGAWGDFATDDKGGDLVSLCAYLFHTGDQLAAAYDVAEQVGFVLPPRKGRQAKQNETISPKIPLNETQYEKVVKKPRSPWIPVLPVPVHASVVPVAHIKRGQPERTWCYRDAEGRVLGYVWRFVTSDGGKEVLPLTWCRNRETEKEDWRGISFPDPRPLYGLDRLAVKDAEAPVLIVEGEKCADAGHEALPLLAVLSWPGGGKAVDKADWTPLAGRNVTIWPDCDAQRDKTTQELLPEEKQPGIKAARRIAEILHALGCTVWLIRIPPPGAVVSGWDIADALDEMDPPGGLIEFMRGRLERYPPPGAPFASMSEVDKTIFTADSAGAGIDIDPPADDEWKRRLLYTKQGELNVCVMNVHDILMHMPTWQGVIAFDEFAQRTIKLKPPPYYGGTVGEWEGTDDTRTAMWLSRTWRLAASSGIVAEAIETLAKTNIIHPVRDWLRSRRAWDGTSRVEMWLIDYCGVADTPYVRKLSRYFLIGMIARVMQPGVKFDYCLVLEGEQGKRKSMVVRVLGGEWHGDTDLDLHNKDSMSALRGKWVYEFSEMGAVTRAEATKQKSFLSRQFDEFRPVYGRREICLARQVVFIGTTNEWEWNKDPTGGRRFWPVDCAGEINIEGLQDAREQLFAEALTLYDAGEQFWPTPDEQNTFFNPEQLRRELQESLVDALHDWVWSQVSTFSVADAVMEGLNLKADKLTRDLQTRVGIALRKLGCERVEKRNGMIRYGYKPPTRKEATSMSPIPPVPLANGGPNVPF